jgi:hypothetical protein
MPGFLFQAPGCAEAVTDQCLKEKIPSSTDFLLTTVGGHA